MTGPAERIEWRLIHLAVFFAPMRSLHVPGVYLTLSDVLFASAILVRTFPGMPRSPFGNATQLWFAGATMLGLGLLASSIVNGDPSRGLSVTVQYYAAYFLLPLAIMGRTFDEALSLTKTALLAITVVCIIGLVAYSLGLRSLERDQITLVTGSNRVASLVSNPNGLAINIALYLPIWGLLSAKRIIHPLVSILLFVTLFFTLLLTSSNSGIFTSLVAFSVFLLLSGNFKLYLRLVLAASVALLVLHFFGDQILSETFYKRVVNALVSGDVNEAGTFSDRMDLNLEALQFAQENLIFGFGADQFRHHSVQGLQVHNTYLLIINEGGLIALLGMMFVLTAGFVVGVTAAIEAGDSIIAAACIAVVFCYALIMMAATHIYSRELAVPMLLLLSVGVSACLRPRHANAPMIRRAA